MFRLRATASTLTAFLVLVVSALGLSTPRSVAHKNPLLPGGVLVSSTELVAVPVTVTNQAGSFVGGLTQADFRIWQDGRQENITYFEQQDTPVTVGLIVDHSGSMLPKLRAVAAAVNLFAHSSNPQDQMFVIDFANTVKFERLDGNEFTSDPRVLQQAVARVSATGETALYDAVAAGLERLNQGRWPKKALIIVSDGGDNLSRHTSGQVLRMARRSHAVIYAVGLVGAVNEQEDPEVLKHLAKATGGIALFPKRIDAIRAESAQIARDIRSAYMIGYRPPTSSRPGSYHKIRVQVAAKRVRKLRVRARPGYFTARDSQERRDAALLP